MGIYVQGMVEGRMTEQWRPFAFGRTIGGGGRKAFQRSFGDAYRPSSPHLVKDLDFLMPIASRKKAR